MSLSEGRRNLKRQSTYERKVFDTPEDAVAYVKNGSGALAFGRIDGIGRVEPKLICSLGPFLMPPTLDVAEVVGYELVKKLERELHISVPALGEICGHLCSLLNATNVPEKLVKARLVSEWRSDPDIGNESSARDFHFDFDAQQPERDFLRLIVIFEGPTTEWLHASNSTWARHEIGVSSKALLDDKKSGSDEVRRKDTFLTPEAHVAVFRGGTRYKVIHRAPKNFHRRFWLQATTC